MIRDNTRYWLVRVLAPRPTKAPPFQETYVEEPHSYASCSFLLYPRWRDAETAVLDSTPPK